MVLTRELIRDGWIQRLVTSSDEPVRVLSEDELRRSREGMLAGHPAGQDLAVFAYGSLIWNPCFHFARRELAHVHGFHRRFCLWTHLGRGTRENPGLMLGLDTGGSCRGVLYTIAAADIASELDIVWRREMVTAAYRPTWVMARTEGRAAPGDHVPDQPCATTAMPAGSTRPRSSPPSPPLAGRWAPAPTISSTPRPTSTSSASPIVGCAD